MNTLYFDASDLRGIVNGVGLDRLMDLVIEALHQACLAFDPATTFVPARDGFEYRDPNVGLIEWMPTMKSGGDVVIKVVGYHPANPGTRDIPTILSTALSFDTGTGQLVALIDGTFLTALRTGAASALASRILAPTNSSVLGLVGAGSQAISQLHALSRVLPIEEVVYYDIDSVALNTFSERAAQLNLGQVRFVPSTLAGVVQSADVLCTSTSVGIGEGPIFADNYMKPAVHVNAVGSDFPGKLEIPYSLLQRSLVCPDFPAQAIREGECQQLQGDQIGPDLIELVQNESDYVGIRQTSSVFDSTGWAFEDYIVFKLLVEQGLRLGYGKELQLTELAADSRNPYAFLRDEPDQDTTSSSTPLAPARNSGRIRSNPVSLPK